MRPKGSAKELEARRRHAIQLLLEGRKQAEVARLVGASSSSVKRWKEMVEKSGMEGLKAKPHPGRPCRLSSKQMKRLEKILLKGPRAAGYSTELWTCPRVAEVIERTFGVSYHPDHVWRLLHDVLGWSCQKPEDRGRKRDEPAIEGWRKRRWPHIKKSPQEASIRCPY